MLLHSPSKNRESVQQVLPVVIDKVTGSLGRSRWVSAVCCATQYSTAYLVTYSTADITYLSPPLAIWKGSATSSAHLSPTAPPRKLRRGGTLSSHLLARDAAVDVIRVLAAPSITSRTPCGASVLTGRVVVAVVIGDPQRGVVSFTSLMPVAVVVMIVVLGFTNIISPRTPSNASVLVVRVVVVVANGDSRLGAVSLMSATVAAQSTYRSACSRRRALRLVAGIVVHFAHFRFVVIVVEAGVTGITAPSTSLFTMAFVVMGLASSSSCFRTSLVVVKLASSPSAFGIAVRVCH
ncbi:unnamed protein product [Phytophthora fragariaefolia]|uniref:Unnamed protein product n=1 Tax=Phytophthora fragariaefolia TaxID=1490495 RepID=A0A9W6UAW1_9STRA|nr:unnamed protein product [Phytophthora fragariaefolia]